MAAVWLPIVSYFAFHHALDALLYNVFTYNLAYINAIPWSSRLYLCKGTLRTLAQTEAIVWAFAALGLAAAWIKPRAPAPSRGAQKQSRPSLSRAQLTLFLASWLTASAVGINASGYYYPHYFQQWLPVLAIAAAISARQLFETESIQRIPPIGRGISLAVLFTLLPALTLHPFYFRYSPSEAVRKIYPGNFFAEMPEVGRQIAQLTKPDDRIYIFGMEAELLFYAKRASATRYIFLDPLYGPYRDAKEQQIKTGAEITAAQPSLDGDSPQQSVLSARQRTMVDTVTLSYIQQNFRYHTYFVLIRRAWFILSTMKASKTPCRPVTK